MTDEQKEQVGDIARLIGGDDERHAYLDMLTHELRGRDDLRRDELRRVAVEVWRRFLQLGWVMDDPRGAA